MSKQMKRRVYSYNFALGNYARFKKKEVAYKLKLKAGNYYIMRFDGSGMTAGFKIKHKAINETYQTANPHFLEGKEYQENCQRCVSAYEARRRGYDVTASKRLYDGTDTLPYMMNSRGWANVYENGIASLETLSGSRSSTIMASIQQRMSEFGDGARAIIRVQWQGGYGGHVFIAEQANGVTQFIDPQTGSRDCSDYFKSGMIKPSATRLLRIDDKKFTDLIGQCIVS